MYDRATYARKARRLRTGSNWSIFLGHKAMPKIEDDILEQFFQELEKAEGFTKERVDSVRALFKAGKKPKATDFVKVLSDPLKERFE